MSESWNKKERQKMKKKQRQDKAEKMQERKEHPKKSQSLDDMLAYVDENGNLSSTPPDRRRRVEIKAEDIEIGVPKYVEPTQEELTRTGKITFFNHDKGFGFIKDQVSQESVFVHVNNLSGGSVKENDKVTFEVEMGQRGPSAINVKVLN
jgi:cold shock CspA family protein